MKSATAPAKEPSALSLAERRPEDPGAPGITIRNILVPIDFSEPSLAALGLALPLLKRFGAKLHLVHVFPPDYPLASMAAMPLVVLDSTVAKRVRRHLKEVAFKYSAPLARGNIHALQGRPFEEICRLARKQKIDLIVTSSRGLTGFKHLALGSTAERIVRHSPCPVLVLRSAENQKTGRNGHGPAPKLSFGKILVPIDFSDCALKGLAYAKALARKFRSKLVLLHSVAPQYYVTNDEYARYDFSRLMQQCENAARDQMRELVEETDWDGVNGLETSLQAGHPGDQICSRAADHRVDLIVISTHGRTGLRHVFLGSTAEYVVRHSPCPVLVIPGYEREVINTRKEK